MGRIRKRPGKKGSNAKNEREAFGAAYGKRMPIPLYIEDYKPGWETENKTHSQLWRYHCRHSSHSNPPGENQPPTMVHRHPHLTPASSTASVTAQNTFSLHRLIPDIDAIIGFVLNHSARSIILASYYTRSKDFMFPPYVSIV